MTNVERCSKKETLQGIARFMQTAIVCSHVKYVQRPLAERTICIAHITKCHEENLELYKCDNCEKTFVFF